MRRSLNALGEVLRLEIRERMSGSEKARQRISKLTEDMATAIGRVDQRVDDDASRFLDALSTQSRDIAAKMEGIRASVSSTITHFADRIETREVKDQIVSQDDPSTDSVEDRDEDVWVEHTTDEGHTYFHSPRTGESRWHRPTRANEQEKGTSDKHEKTQESTDQAIKKTVGESVKKIVRETVGGTVKEIVKEAVRDAMREYERQFVELDQSVKSERQDYLRWREETDVKGVEARQERTALRRANRVMANQHEASLALYQSTLTRHAVLVSNMDERSQIERVMDSMLSRLETGGLLDRVMMASENVESRALRVEELAREETVKRQRSFERREDEMRAYLDDILRHVRERLSELEMRVEGTGQDRSQLSARIRDVRDRVESETQRISRLERQVESEVLRTVLQDDLVRSVEDSEIKRQQHVLSSEIRELRCRVARSERSLVPTCEALRTQILSDMESRKETEREEWISEMERAQAFLDGASSFVKEGDAKTAIDATMKKGPIIAISGVFPEE